ncbi:MAG: sodium:proton antiporter NhaD [Fimbriimonadales bacterium]
MPKLANLAPLRLALLVAFLGLPALTPASGSDLLPAELVRHWTAWLALGLFAVGYAFVILEEKTHLRKSIPMIVAAGVLWILVSVSPVLEGIAGERLRHNILEFAELFLFILAAVTYVNTMEERQVFDVMRGWLIRKGLTLRGIFWATGGIAFLMSPIADNLTTTLVMGAVAISVGGNVPRFVVPACINIVVAANAGGAFSPFGDITTLMVWQKGHLEFTQFFALFLPSLVNWLIPAVLMARAVPKDKPEIPADQAALLPGARVVVALFLTTIVSTVLLHNLFHLPAAIGMMTGFGVLHLYGHFLRRAIREKNRESEEVARMLGGVADEPQKDSFDVFGLLARVEWDTLMFFYGVILCVGALGAFGFLHWAASSTYGSLGPTWTNVGVGVASAVFDNIPLMAAILTVSPEMNHSQWLLVTLTAGVGGSLLSIGSAAGVALMGQARGIYTFGAHLKWSWAVALGYVASVWLHLVLNGR